jgi:hypothetical protein
MTENVAKEGAKRDRSPKFPYIGLKKALERIEVLHGKVKRYEARIADIAKDWDLSPKSSSTDRNVAALQSFGLIEDSGNGENRKIKLSELGARIIADQRPGVRESLLAEAALKPPIISDYHRKWIGGRPDEAHALSQLQFEGGFTAEGARLFLRVFDETIRFIASSHSEKTADFEEDEDSNAEVEFENGADLERSAKPKIPKRRLESKTGMKEDVFSLHEGDVTFQWPETISAESFEDLEDWMKLMLRKIKRSIGSSRGTENESYDG